MRKLLILSAGNGCTAEQVRNAAGCQFDIVILPPSASVDVRMAAFSEAEIIIGEPTLEELSVAKKLRWVQMTWAGADRYLQSGFPEQVLLTTASGAFGETIAEHAVAMLTALCRRLPAYVRCAEWCDLGTEKPLEKGTAMIFGAGDIGGNIARRLKSFNMRVIGVCRNPGKPRRAFDILTTLTGAESFLHEADFVLCALPHTPQTAGYFNAARLAKLKSDAVLVNVGRGSFINTDALCQCLQNGKLFGVGLDVVEPEPLPKEHPLWSMPNVVLTPHVAGVSFGHLAQTEKRIWEICAGNIRNYLCGSPLRNLVDTKRGKNI